MYIYIYIYIHMYIYIYIYIYVCASRARTCLRAWDRNDAVRHAMIQNDTAWRVYTG